MDITAYQHLNIRMSTRGKRPLRNLTPSDKVRAIQRIHNGETKASVSRDIGVPESTLRGWCKNEHKLRFMCRQLGTEQISINGLENPPEKRCKLESQSTSPNLTISSNFQDFGYNHHPLNGLNFGTISNTNGGLVSEKLVIEEILKKTCFQAEYSKYFDARTSPSGLSSLPASDEFSQLPMFQNLSLLPHLNAAFFAMPCFDTALDNKHSKAPLRTLNSVDDTKDNTKTNLTVKNWAKEPAEILPAPNTNNYTNTNANDTNNNDMKSKPSIVGEISDAEKIFPSVALSGVTNGTADTESSAVAMLEWCKLFNASRNFLALAAAAAVMQPPGAPSTMFNNILFGNMERTTPIENILYKQMTKIPNSFNSSDVSNDSYLDSEPEDLSVRSTISKILSPTNSRSQSPTKSTASSASSNSEEEM